VNEDEEFPIEAEDEPQVIDHFAHTQRAASIVGDLRACLRKEGFTREEAFELVQMFWASELGVLA
jgi:hypothetical protein